MIQTQTKIVSGGDFNTEFLAVKTSVNSKADLANTSQVVTAATASAGTNTNQLATTAFVTAAMTAATINPLAYPVGAVYINATVTPYANSAALLGVGTWAAYGEGRVPVGKAGSGTFDTLGATGGAETHTLSVAEMPAHTHSHDNGSFNQFYRWDQDSIAQLIVLQESMDLTTGATLQAQLVVEQHTITYNHI